MDTKKQKTANIIKQHLFVIVLLVVSTVFQFAGADATQTFHYERAAILSGEVWRLMSAHLVHLGWAHFVLNMVALLIIWGFFWREWQQRIWVITFVFISIGISLGLLLFQPILDWTVGLSGALHGLFAVGVIGAIRRGYLPAIIMLAILVAKLLWEQFSPIPGSEQWIGGTVVTSAHLYGAIAGAIIALILLLYYKIQ